ncbi:MAG: hypothetical protein ACUVTZ_05560 [Armatimonadota bacterium]
MSETKPKSEGEIVASNDRWIMRRRTKKKDDGRTITYYTFQPLNEVQRTKSSEGEASDV